MKNTKMINKLLWNIIYLRKVCHSCCKDFYVLWGKGQWKICHLRFPRIFVDIEYVFPLFCQHIQIVMLPSGNTPIGYRRSWDAKSELPFNSSLCVKKNLEQAFQLKVVTIRVFNMPLKKIMGRVRYKPRMTTAAS